ncbi:MAG: ABC transporter ATP-binding protein, partial [Flavobacteriales bacterium]
MKELKALNRFFWKYKGRLLLGLFFIVLTNFLTVYTPKLIKDGVNMLSEANKQYYLPIEKAKEAQALDGKELDLAPIFKKGKIETPSTIAQLEEPLNLKIVDSDNIENKTDLGKLLISLAVILAALYLVIYFLKGVFLFFTRQTIIVMSRLIEYDMKKEIFDQYQRLNVSFYKRNNTGDLMNRISEDVSKVRMYLGPAVMYTLNLLVLIVLVIYEMSSINVELTLYSLMPLPFMSVGVYYVSSMINRKSERVQNQQSKLSTMVQESISGIRVLKAYYRENYSKDSFQEESEIYKTRALDLVKIDALFIPIIVLLVGLSTILTIYIGGIKVINGELDLGAVFQFVFYVNMLTWPFASVGWVTSLVQKAEASQERINEFMEVEPEIQNPTSEDFHFKGKIEFKNVSFTYPDSGIEALKNISFKLSSGKTLAIIGRTGSGKSTLANLLVRHYDSTSGSILLDDKKIDSI